MSQRLRFLTTILHSPPLPQPWHSPPIPQPPPPTQPRPDYRPPPITKGLCANFGLILLIIAIVGIIIFYTVPWFTVNEKFAAEDDDDEHEYTGNYGQDFEWMFGDDDFEDTMGDEYLEHYDDAQDFLGGTIGLAIIGLIFILIIAIIAMIVGWLPRFHDRWPKLSKALDVTVGLITILPTLMLIFCSMRFLGVDVQFAHHVAVTEHLGYDVDGWVIFPAAYVLLIIGIIILFFAISIIRRGMEGMFIEDQRRARRALPPTPPARPRTPKIRQQY